MNKKVFSLLALLLIFSLSTTAARADDLYIENDTDVNLDEDYPWRNHKAHFDFVFGNMIDTHQQSRFDSNDVLHGYIYIHYTGEYTEDGIPIARKADCKIESCNVGWVIKGIPYSAILVNKGPRIWLITPAGLPTEPGYTHFHWLGGPDKPHGLVIGNSYEGYLLKRVAVTTFYWLGGSGGGNQSGGCSGDDGGCSDGETGGDCSGEEGGCSSDEGGCSDGGDMGGGSSGHGGRLVQEGLDSHSNVVTSWDGTWQGGGCDD